MAPTSSSLRRQRARPGIGRSRAHPTPIAATGCSRVNAEFDQRNFMGMNASDYGGGTPVVDVWRRDCGLAVGHVETVPKLVALPLTMTEGGARVAVECDQAVTLATGRELFDLRDIRCRASRRLFRDARRLSAASSPSAGWRRRRCPRPPMSRSGAPGAMSAISPSMQVVGTLPKARELGLGWAGLDDGWQTAVGRLVARPGQVPARRRRHDRARQRHQAGGHEAQALDRAACGASRERPPARSSRHAAPRQARRAAGRDLVGQLLPVPRLSGDGGVDKGARPQDHGRMGLCGAQARRPASQRRRALLQSRRTSTPGPRSRSRSCRISGRRSTRKRLRSIRTR